MLERWPLGLGPAAAIAVGPAGLGGRRRVGLRCCCCWDCWRLGAGEAAVTASVGRRVHRPREAWLPCCCCWARCCCCCSCCRGGDGPSPSAKMTSLEDRCCHCSYLGLVAWDGTIVPETQSWCSSIERAPVEGRIC